MNNDVFKIFSIIYSTFQKGNELVKTDNFEGTRRGLTEVVLDFEL